MNKKKTSAHPSPSLTINRTNAEITPKKLPELKNKQPIHLLLNPLDLTRNAPLRIHVMLATNLKVQRKNLLPHLEKYLDLINADVLAVNYSVIRIECHKIIIKPTEKRYSTTHFSALFPNQHHGC